MGLRRLMGNLSFKKTVLPIAAIGMIVVFIIYGYGSDIRMWFRHIGQYEARWICEAHCAAVSDREYPAVGFSEDPWSRPRRELHEFFKLWMPNRTELDVNIYEWSVSEDNLPIVKISAWTDSVEESKAALALLKEQFAIFRESSAERLKKDLVRNIKEMLMHKNDVDNILELEYVLEHIDQHLHEYHLKNDVIYKEIKR